MRVLIVGLGYAGRRYQRAFLHLGQRLGISLELAHVARRKRTRDVPFYENIKTALVEFHPHVVVVSVNDHSHTTILRELAGYSGFVICEKPLAVPGEDWSDIARSMSCTKGFALDLVERYSDASRYLRKYVVEHNWSLVRASFHWGKDRINDYRPTCGVVSEVIHALDLIKWIGSDEGDLQLDSVSGIRSDFSISGPDVLDTVLLTGRLDSALVAGYSSFVNVERQRTVDFTFVDDNAVIFHSRIVFDTPEWDRDHLRIWTRDESGNEVTVTDLTPSERKDGLETVEKLSSLCQDALLFTLTGQTPQQPFADLTTATKLQLLLDEIDSRAVTGRPAQYCRGGIRKILQETAALESLG